VCRASTGFCWTITAYTVLSSAGMAQGFAGPARLLPDALRVATGLCPAKIIRPLEKKFKKLGQQAPLPNHLKKCSKILCMKIVKVSNFK
jgi:hypothetical protein